MLCSTAFFLIVTTVHCLTVNGERQILGLELILVAVVLRLVKARAASALRFLRVSALHQNRVFTAIFVRIVQTSGYITF